MVPDEPHSENQQPEAQGEANLAHSGLTGLDRGATAVYGGVDAFLAITQESRARLSEAVIQSLEDGLAIREASGRIRPLNAAMHELLARCAPPAGAEATGLAAADATLAVILNPGGELLGPYDILLPALDGEPLTYSVTPTPLRSPGSGQVCVVRDMTLVRRNRRDSLAFISQVTHELRTPLQHILSYAALLRELGGLTNDQRAEFLGVIEEEAERLSMMVEDLLQLARLDQGRLGCANRRTHLSQLVNRLVVKFGPHALSHQIALHETVEPEVWADTDPLRYEQVLGNLLSNAQRYVQAGGEVCVTLRREGPLAVATVSDNGPGMAPETLQHLYEPFYQGAAGIASGGGYGLGLSIGRQIIEALGGSIGVESREGEGSTFTVRLPASPPHGNA